MLYFLNVENYLQYHNNCHNENHEHKTLSELGIDTVGQGYVVEKHILTYDPRQNSTKGSAMYRIHVQLQYSQIHPSFITEEQMC